MKKALLQVIGAEAVLEMLKNLSKLDLERKNLIRLHQRDLNLKLMKQRAIKRLKLIESFIETGQKPEWMIMTVSSCYSSRI